MRKEIVATALWMMESAGDSPISITDVASSAGVSVFHLTRTFAAATGIPPARYHRLRRLTEAARALAERDDPLIQVALGAGYGSQEAFTRAFAANFGVTPAAVRRGRPVPHHRTQEAFAMRLSETRSQITPPRFETALGRRIVGLAARYSFETNGGIPGQWVDFLMRAAAHDLPLGAESFGVCFDSAEDGTFSYLVGVETPTRTVPKDFVTVILPAGRYAVFTHRGPAATLRSTVAAIWVDFLPRVGLDIRDGPDFELYPAGYDPTAQDGLVEIWVPVSEVGALAWDGTAALDDGAPARST